MEMASPDREDLASALNRATRSIVLMSVRRKITI